MKRIKRLIESTMASLPARRAGAKLRSLIELAAELPTPTLVAGERSSVVVLSAKYWRSRQVTQQLLSIPGMRKSIRDAMAERVSASAKRLRW